jgi:norsolorinic acid ketoreductase
MLIKFIGSTVGSNPISSLTPDDLRTDFEVNTIGPLVLFNAFSPLLLEANKKSPGTTKFVVISTIVAQITNTMPVPLNSYGATKAASNFLTKKIDMETPEVIAFPIQ